MGEVKDIIIKVIPASIANPFVKKVHYSGKVVQNSQLHFGAFLDGKLHGVLSYGPSLMKHNMQHLVAGTGWNEFIELNRMAFDEYLPRNSESYAIAKTLRLIKREAPQIKWVLSFADGTQCGDGTIYRAANFVLTGIVKNNCIILLPNGEKIASTVLTSHRSSPATLNAKRLCKIPLDSNAPLSAYLQGGARKMDGYMLRYIYFIDKSCKEKLTVPIIPFSAIDEVGAGMYKGENVTRAERHAKRQPEGRLDSSEEVKPIAISR